MLRWELSYTKNVQATKRNDKKETMFMECAPPNRPNAVFPSCDRSYMRIALRAFVLPQGGIVLRAESLLYVSA